MRIICLIDCISKHQGCKCELSLIFSSMKLKNGNISFLFFELEESRSAVMAGDINDYRRNDFN